MFSTKEILEKKSTEEQLERTKLNTAVQLTAGVKNLNTAVTAVPDKQIDLIINDYDHLTGGTTNRLSGWYAGEIRKGGIDRFVRLAKRAKQEGKNPARYFSWLLKNET